MSERKIKVVVVDGLTAEDVLKLKAGGFFEGAEMPLPPGATGQAGVLRVKEVPVTLTEKLEPSELANTSETMRPVVLPVRDDVKVAEALTPRERVHAETAVLNDMLQKVAEAPVEKKAKTKAPKPTEAEVDAFIAGRQGELNAVVALASTSKAELDARDPATEPLKPEPQGNGKKLPAKHAVKGGTYVVRAFGAAWYATADGMDKGGPAFILRDKAEPNRIYTQEGTLVEEVSVEQADEEALATSAEIDMSPETLAGFTKLRDLIQYAIECGIPAEGMAEFCESMKDEVPLLQRIANIGDRVQRTLEVMGLK